MAKRFTDTEIWNDPWYRKLPLEAKTLWRFLLDRCDSAGFWKKDYELATFQMGLEITAGLLDELNQGKERIKDYGDHLEVVQFVDFQYGTLNPEVRPHKPVIKLLSYYKSKGYRKGINTLKEQEQDKDKEQEQDSEQDDFDKVWDIYPRKVAKKKAQQVWKKVPTSEKPLIYADIERRRKSGEYAKENIQYVLHFATYLHGERWKDQVSTPSTAAPPRKKCPECNQEKNSWVGSLGVCTDCFGKTKPNPNYQRLKSGLIKSIPT